ncbi:Uncharacterised protein [Lysinibacillus capsici]|uniref:Uncharacterized protein n=1 Tax=Lysinibacillus capsici TaxID=2115968 RepID=A0A2X1AJA4_9BACI|nr:hypothetical protein [Lysinibacillus capsici]SPU40702.1 Uncharacterised protein [Lysinibacillus capsici]
MQTNYGYEERLVEINFEELSLEIDINNPSLTDEEIANAALEQLNKNFWPIIENKINCKLLPKNTLTQSTAFTGRIVEEISTNQIGVISKTDFQNQKSITVLFPNGDTKLFFTHELKETELDTFDMAFIPHKYVPGEAVERNKIYLIQTQKNTGLAVMNPTRSLNSDRWRVSFFTTSPTKKVEFMATEDIISSIIND